jgi:2-polyprenyl-6-methoxyphenol hydroxylase-like FAD-dependent oxidoreductase
VNKDQSVLIAGAGPCGLVVACALRKLGITVRILDSEADRATGSRAIMLWPPALEVLDGIGLLQNVRRRALQPQAYIYHIGSGRPMRVRFRPEYAPLVLPQQETNELVERKLAELGCHVERAVQVTEVKSSADAVTVRARRGDGTELTIESDWVIGADGVHSAVRKQLGIDFAGAQYPYLFLLAEAKLDGELDPSGVHITVRRDGMLLAPLPNGDVRVSTVIGDGTPLTAETVQRLLDERGPGGGLRVSGVTTLTTFLSHERLAGSMSSGRCFLVGDAAHMNSVFGGQGLSLGFQDGHNLAWKLAGVINDRLDPSILSSYDPERRAAVQQTIRLTRRMIQQGDAGPMARLGRDALLRLLCATGVMEREHIPMLAGRRIRYPDVLMSKERHQSATGTARRGATRLPSPGTRAPEWVPASGQDSFGMFRLITTGSETGGTAEAARLLAERRPLIVRHDHIRRPARGPRAESFVLVRPDGFVACSGRALEVGRAGMFLDALSTGDQPAGAAASTHGPRPPRRMQRGSRS